MQHEAQQIQIGQKGLEEVEPVVEETALLHQNQQRDAAPGAHAEMNEHFTCVVSRKSKSKSFTTPITFAAELRGQSRTHEMKRAFTTPQSRAFEFRGVFSPSLPWFTWFTGWSGIFIFYFSSTISRTKRARESRNAIVRDCPRSSTAKAMADLKLLLFDFLLTTQVKCSFISTRAPGAASRC